MVGRDVAEGRRSDLEVIEEGCGSFGIDSVLTEGGKNHGEGEQQGLTVFDGREVELDGRAGVGEVFGEDGFAANGVAVREGVDGVVGAVGWWVEGADAEVCGCVEVAKGA
jgi:hypothetical protein